MKGDNLLPKSGHISNSVIRRLPRYYRFLGELLKEGVAKISSRELSERMQITASQIRQDLNCFGGFGQQGYGYNVAELREEISRIIGIEKNRKIIIIGAGYLGHALARNMEFEKYGCIFTGIFDNNRKICGTGEINVRHISELGDFCASEKPEIAVLCIPKTAVRATCETLIELGVKAFWNFSHYDINLAFKDIIVENVHLGDSLLTLNYNVNNKNI